MIKIRPAEPEDYNQIWPIIHEAFVQGDSYAFLPETSREEGFHIWMETPLTTYVAIEDERVVGTYYLKPNQPGLGSHVCNAGYIVDSKARGKGIGRSMCEHSLKEARKFGFKAMQYNCVVVTNQAAVALWKKCGFNIIGTLKSAFNHKEKGFLDAFVMYQWFD